MNPDSDYPLICIHRADLHQILMKNTQAELHTGDAFRSYTQTKEGKIGQWENPVATTLRNWAFQFTPSKVTMRLIEQYSSYRVTQLDI
jgi:hypothetical protein